MTATVTPIKPQEALDLDILSALDFDPTPPCEHSQHHTKHVPDEFAAYVIITKCPKCQTQTTYNICESGRTHILNSLCGCQTIPGRKVGCGYAAPGRDFIIACTPLNSTF